VAFSIKLGKPNADQITFFNKLFGGPPEVMLTVLKPAPKEKNKYVLAGGSKLFELTNYFGSEPTFALLTPLSIKPGFIVGITVRPGRRRSPSTSTTR